MPMQPLDLPAPEQDAAEHSARVAAALREAIEAAGGELSFADYMEQVLYAPGLGYYSAGAQKFGSDGDFITAPEISSLFSRCLAQQLRELLGACGGDIILELGGGSGTMAADILLALHEQEALPREYWILEVSGELRERQRDTLHARAPALLERVRWLERLPEALFRGVIVGNEVLDALPAERFRRTADGIEQLTVRVGQLGLEWGARPAPPALADAVAHLEADLGARLSAGYESEIRLGLGGLIAGLAAGLERGALLFLDYGYPRNAYYHPERDMGTLMCHYRHRAHGDPFLYPGLQDITAWVDFTAVAEAASAVDLDVMGYTTQASFLLSGGLEAEFNARQTEDAVANAKLAQQVRELTLPDEMGERFKAICLGKDIDDEPSGFAFRDLTHTL